MSTYYHYWERRVFNAIATMLIRGEPASQKIRHFGRWYSESSSTPCVNCDKSAIVGSLVSRCLPVKNPLSHSFSFAVCIAATSRFRAFFNLSPSMCRWPPLIRVTTELHEKEVVIHGSTHTIFKTISKLMQNIISSSTNFARWMNGTCK